MCLPKCLPFFPLLAWVLSQLGVSSLDLGPWLASAVPSSHSVVQGEPQYCPTARKQPAKLHLNADNLGLSSCRNNQKLQSIAFSLRVIWKVTPKTKVPLLECGRTESKCKEVDLLTLFLGFSHTLFMGFRKSSPPFARSFEPLFSWSHHTKKIMWSMMDKHQRGDFYADQSGNRVLPSFDAVLWEVSRIIFRAYFSFLGMHFWWPFGNFFWQLSLSRIHLPELLRFLEWLMIWKKHTEKQKLWLAGVGWGVGCDCLMGMGLPFGVIQKLWTRQCW